VAWSVVGLVGVFGPLTLLVALSEIRGAPLGASLDRSRTVLRARPSGPDRDTGVGRGDLASVSPAMAVDTGARAAAPDRTDAAVPIATGPPGPTGRPLGSDLARSLPTA
jgi:hypothetical protein